MIQQRFQEVQQKAVASRTSPNGRVASVLLVSVPFLRLLVLARAAIMEAWTRTRMTMITSLSTWIEKGGGSRGAGCLWLAAGCRVRTPGHV